MITVRKKVQLRETVRKEHNNCDEPTVPGTLPRVTRLMALAIRFDELLRSGTVRDLAHLAVIGQVSQPRISQILSLVLLAPDIQEALLFHPRMTSGKPSVTEKTLRPIVAIEDWDEQRITWKSLGFGALPTHR